MSKFDDLFACSQCRFYTGLGAPAYKDTLSKIFLSPKVLGSHTWPAGPLVLGSLDLDLAYAGFR